MTTSNPDALEKARAVLKSAMAGEIGPTCPAGVVDGLALAISTYLTDLVTAREPGVTGKGEG